MPRYLYTYVPKQNTVSEEGLLGTAKSPEGWLKYRERSGKATKEEVLKWLDSMVKGFHRSRAISFLTEPIPETAHPDMVAFAKAKQLYRVPDYDTLRKLKIVRAIQSINTGNRRGTHDVVRPSYKHIDWAHKEPGKFLFSNVPHYLVETTDGTIPPEFVEPVV